MVPTNKFGGSIEEEADEELLENEKETDLKEVSGETEITDNRLKESEFQLKLVKRTPEKENCNEKMSLVISNAMKDITIEDKLNAENNIMR